MPLTLQSIPDGSTDYESIVQANWDAIEAAVNSLASQILAVSGDGALLLLDIFDRNGIVGTTSYRLDLENYAGASQITIGRRPAFDAAKQEKNVSEAFGTYGGERTRVTLTGDVVLDAAAIVTGLPKTIYVGIPSDGTPQLFEDNTNPEILFAYSMCWDGFSLTCCKYECPILMAEPTLEDAVGAPACERIYDGSTDWLYHTESRLTLVLGGDGSENEIGLNISRKVVGGFIAASDGEEGFFAPEGLDNKVKLELWDDDDRRWNLEDIELDCQATPTRFFFKIDPVIGDDIFVTKVREFRLVKVSAGGDVLSARQFSWGLYTSPVLGTPVPKNQSKVNVL